MIPLDPGDDLETFVTEGARIAAHNDPDAVIEASLAQMVGHPQYPCLGARSVFRRDNAQIVVMDSVQQPADTEFLAEQLRRFAACTDDSEDFVSLIVSFRLPQISTEREFEDVLWSVLQGLHDGDGETWAVGVSDDPMSSHFAFSHAGTAFFIVGLHPNASRVARRASLPTLVFNRHDQFERLRAEGGFDRMRTAIRTRDVRVQGSINPMADDHGGSSEARQYSGRAVTDTWRPPFETRKALADD